MMLVAWLWALIRFVCFVLLATHLGWSWWLVALLVCLFQVTFTEG